MTDGECQHPRCEETAEVVGIVTVGGTPLGPMYVCEDHDYALSDPLEESEGSRDQDG